MKRNVQFLLVASCLIFSFPAFSQKYKTASDTIKLNKEWVEVSNDIAELTAELSISQNNLPGYKSKDSKAQANAQSTAQQSSDQAYKATNGDVGDAKRAKKKAKKALHDAEDASEAKNNTRKQERKINKLTAQLDKKQKTLHDLEEMRNVIRAMNQ